MKILTFMLLFSATLYTGQSIAQTCNTQIPFDAPNTRYILGTNGTALDKKTGLTWMRCSVGQVWNGSNCTGTPQIVSWQIALSIAESTSFAGKTDWRLPNLNELQSLVESRCADPAINLVAFPSSASIQAWTSTPYVDNRGSSWFVFFNDGTDDTKSKSTRYSFRLVRG